MILPPDSEAWLPTEGVIRLYAERIEIEHCFRDWKSHLGLRGLHLEVERTSRLLRLLMAFTLAHLLTLLRGQDPLAERARAYFKPPRRTPRPRHAPGAPRAFHRSLPARGCALARTRTPALPADRDPSEGQARGPTAPRVFALTPPQLYPLRQQSHLSLRRSFLRCQGTARRSAR